MAKPKNINASDAGGSSPKLFFAELSHQIRDEELLDPFICRCSIVDPDNELSMLCLHYHFDSSSISSDYVTLKYIIDILIFTCL